MFSPDQIRERIRVQPFVPLRIVTSAGVNYDVYHPDMLWVGVREIIVGTPSERRPEFFAGVNRVSIAHIAALEDLPPRAGQKRNGQRSPKKKQ